MKVVVVGGGWAGCGAAISAKKAGAEVTLLERTDMLLGTGLVGGIMRNNGRFTATEECIALGGGDLFEVIEENSRHKNIDFPGHKHADLYDIATTPGAIERFLREKGVDIVFEARVSSVRMEGKKLAGVTAGDIEYTGDVFIDTTGTAGPMNNCTKYGNGCVMCVIRCPSYGGRVSLTGLAGIEEEKGKKEDGSVGAMSGSCKLLKESLAPEIVERLDRDGVVIIPIPEELKEDHLSLKACQQYAIHDYKDNVVLLDTGHAKLMTPFFNLHTLQRIEGFKNARFEDPYSGSKGNSMRFFAMAPRDDTLKVTGVENLFCAGEKAGLLVGHTEAIVTGILAGYNAVRFSLGKKPLTLPRTLAIGEGIAYVREEMKTTEGAGKKYTFSGSVLFEQMKKLDLYITDVDAIRKKVEYCGLTNIFEKPTTDI